MIGVYRGYAIVDACGLIIVHVIFATETLNREAKE